jgi:hypothetical protein
MWETLDIVLSITYKQQAILPTLIYTIYGISTFDAFLNFVVRQ